MARAAAHLGFDRLQAASSRGRYTMVPVGEEQPLPGVEDDDGGRVSSISVYRCTRAASRCASGSTSEFASRSAILTCDMALIIAGNSKIRNLDYRIDVA